MVGVIQPDEDHAWNVYMGLPNATALWQVGDSTAQNGMFKKGLCAATVCLQKLQVQNSEPIRIKDHDIVPMVMSACPDSFGSNVTTNKRAVASRGWNPLSIGTAC